MSEYDDKHGPYPMRIQVLPGSEAEHNHYRAAARYSDERIQREALAPGVTASPQDDLIMRGGFPQLLLAPVNFEALYLQQQQQNAQVDTKETED